ncbi:MAG: fimbrillin family protein [Duncaniella sp.]|nr:fimbrillin family protein [Duncaniella sp.]
MKRSLYLLAGVPLMAALTACTSDSGSEVTPADKVAVQFRAADIASRASVITNDNIKGNPFAVWGDMVLTDKVGTSTPSVLFNGTPVSYKGSGAEAAWQYDDLQYWFPSHSYSFVALCPIGAVDATYANSGISFSYNYPESYQDVKDVLVATHRRDYQFGKGQSTVGLNFRHVFSRINFVANFDDSSPNTSSVTINHITLRGVGVDGNFAITPASISTGSMTDDAAEASASLWSTPTTTGTIFDRSVNITLDKDNNRYEFFNVNTDPLIVIPQTLTGEVEVEITYTPSNQASKTVTSYLLPTAVAAHGGMWLPGQSYTYSFTVGADEIIIFNTPVTGDWNQSEGANFIII